MFAALLSVFLAASPPPAEPVFLSAPVSVQVTTATFDSEHFHLVYSTRAEAPARALAPTLEALRADVVRVLGRDFDGKTEVRVGLGRDEFNALAPFGSKPPGWAVALAWPDANIVLVDARSLATAEGPTTLRHELVHIGLGRFGTGWPRWFQEGLAQMVTHEREFRPTHYSTMAVAAAFGHLYDFDAIANGFPERPADVEVAYAQSDDFVSFLHARHGPERFAELFELKSQGLNFEQAFARAFHTSVSLEEAAFREHVTFRYPWWPVLFMSGSLVWALSSVLMVAAFVKRRRTVRALRAEQRRQDRLEDVSRLLVGPLSWPANDDAGPIEDPLPNEPWRVTPLE